MGGGKGGRDGAAEIALGASGRAYYTHTKLFGDLAVAKIISSFMRFQIFNRFLNWVHIGGVMARQSWGVVVVTWDVARPGALRARTRVRYWYAPRHGS